MFVAFTVRPDGTLGRAYLPQGQNPAVDAAVLAAVRQPPPFVPARQSGQPVAYCFTLPLTLAPPAGH